VPGGKVLEVLLAPALRLLDLDPLLGIGRKERRVRRWVLERPRDRPRVLQLQPVDLHRRDRASPEATGAQQGRVQTWQQRYRLVGDSLPFQHQADGMRWRRRRNPVERDLHCRRLFAPSKPGGCELRADFEAMSESLNGRLLIASPSMPDYFHRAVILVVEHSDQGAFGLVLNRPSETTVGDASPELAELIGDDHLIHVGGPVQPNAVTAVGEHSDPADATKLIIGTVGMVDLDDPPELPRLRVFAGDAGWGGGPRA